MQRAPCKRLLACAGWRFRHPPLAAAAPAKLRCFQPLASSCCGASSSSSAPAPPSAGSAAAALAAARPFVAEPEAEEVVEDTALVPSKGKGVARFVTKVPMPGEVAEFDVRQSFQKFAFRREVQLGVMKMGLSVPTRVQDVTIPQIMNGISVFMLAQTGTGKTLAYLLPIIHKLLETNREGFYPAAKRPRAIIIQPTRELCMQTIKILRYFPLKSMLSAPGHSFSKEVQALRGGIDVIVATPFRLIIHLGKEDMFLKDLQHVVLDEADTLCDTFYKEDVAKVMAGLERECAVQPQVVVVGATRTGAVSAFMRQHLSGTAIVPIATTDAHKTPAQVEQVFVPTRGKRLQAVLWDVLSEVPVVGKKTLIFTNRVESCKGLMHSMLEHGYSAVGLYGGLHPNRRKQVWKEFTGTGADVMVCTNLASRGLDFSNVHHVVMYEFPLNMADYLHRVGRTARGGRAGRVTTITPRRYWPFVVKLQQSCAEGTPIEVKHATKHAKKLMAIENYMKVAQSGRLGKLTKRAIKRRLGLPPARNLGSKETKAAMKALDRRIAAIKKMRFLQSRGILMKGHGIPKLPDRQVEASESQTVSTLVRAKDGLLQVMPRRRRKKDTEDPNSAPAENVEGGTRREPRGAALRRRRPQM